MRSNRAAFGQTTLPPTRASNLPAACRPCSGACQAEADFGLRRGLGARQRSLASRFRLYARRRLLAAAAIFGIRLRVGCHYAELLPCGGIYAVCPSSRVDKYRGTMRFREERIDFAPLPVECQRMCACFGWHHLLAAHFGNIDDIQYPRVADGHVKVRGLRMQENHVRGAAEGDVPEHATRRCVNREQCARIAGAK